MSFTTRFQELSSSLSQCSYDTKDGPVNEQQALALAHYLIGNCHLQGGIIYVIGNGGSAGIASHFSNDLMKALRISSQTLYDSNLMTCLSNDIGYDQVFSYPLERLLKPTDLLVAISSSGKSPNILNAVRVAQDRRTATITLSGFDSNNPLRGMGVLNFWISRTDYGLVETAHFFLLHTIIDTWHKKPTLTAEYAQIARELYAKQNQNPQ